MHTSGGGFGERHSPACPCLTPMLLMNYCSCQYKVDARLKPDAKDLIQNMLRLNPLERATLPDVRNSCFQLEICAWIYVMIIRKIALLLVVVSLLVVICSLFSGSTLSFSFPSVLKSFLCYSQIFDHCFLQRSQKIFKKCMCPEFCPLVEFCCWPAIACAYAYPPWAHAHGATHAAAATSRSEATKKVIHYAIDVS